VLPQIFKLSTSGMIGPPNLSPVCIVPRTRIRLVLDQAV